MRSLVLALFMFGSVPFAIYRPIIGLYVYSLFSYMSPQRLTWGFTRDFPFALIMAIVTLLAWFFNKNEPKKLPMAGGTALILIMMFWVSLTTVLAIEPWHAYLLWLRFIKILAVSVLILIMVNSRERLDGLIWVIFISIGFYAVKGGIFALLTAGSYRVYGPQGSMISDNNTLAVATLMTVPLVRYLQLNATNKWIRRGLLACMPIMVASALSSYSRGALLTMVIMGLFMWMKSRRKMMLGVGIIVIAVIGYNFMPEKWFDRMQTIETYQQNASAMGRINAWHFAFNFTKDHPVFGGGFLVFDINSLWPKYAPNPAVRLNAHSIYFQVMAEQGFVGLFLFLTTFFVCFRNGSRVIRQTKRRPELAWARDLASLAQVSLIGYAVGGAFLDMPYYDLPWDLCAILLVCRFLVEREISPTRAAERATGSDAAVLSSPRPTAVAAHPTFLRDAAARREPATGYLRRKDTWPSR